MWYGWVEVLSEGGQIHSESLWVQLPTVSVGRWVDLGWNTILERAWAALSQTRNSDVSHVDATMVPRLIGVRVSGSGKSSHLAYARRWLIDRDMNVHWLTDELMSHQTQEYAEPSASLDALLIDNLHLPTRATQWDLVGLITRWRQSLEYQEVDAGHDDTQRLMNSRRGLMVVWSDDETQVGLSALLANEVDELMSFNLNHGWRDYEETLKTSKRGEEHWLLEYHPDLTLSDHLRCQDLIDRSLSRESQYSLGDIDAYAALIGPLASVKVIARAVELSEDTIREILGNAGWLEVDQHAQAGARFVPPSPEFWRAALLEGGARAHLPRVH